MDVIDLHCDLLSYLALLPERTPLDPSPLCSGPQLKDGGVITQVLAIASITNIFSVAFAMQQLDWYLRLPTEYPKYFSDDHILPAFENASGFALENEPLETVLQRLEKILTKITPLYIGLTWNGENRFGGGCGSQAGLKEDGKELLHFLSGREIAIDFSHTSDRLANEILTFIDQKHLNIPVMASHSNFRAIYDHERNLPNEIALEIIKRKGVLGLNLYPKFHGEFQNIFAQVEHGLTLGGEQALAWGADFFCLDDVPSYLQNPTPFFKEMPDASHYPSLYKMIRENLSISPKQLENIFYTNAQNFIASRKK